MAKKLTPGMTVNCNGGAPWKYKFIGVVEKVLKNSVVVIIAGTHIEDDYLVGELKGKTVISKKKVTLDQVD